MSVRPPGHGASPDATHAAPAPARPAGADGRAAPLRRVERALRRATAPFPYLAGLAAQARVAIDDRVPTWIIGEVRAGEPGVEYVD